MIKTEFTEIEVGSHKCYVYVPEKGEELYPLMLLQDGKRIVNDINAWVGNRKPSYMIVAIEPNNRNDEYTPWIADVTIPPFHHEGKAGEYIAWLKDSLLEVLLGKYSIDTQRISIGGYSFGALVSLYALYQGFSARYLLACSTSLWYPKITEYILSRDVPKIDYVYMSCGNVDSDDYYREMNHHAGYSAKKLTEIFNKHNHPVPQIWLDDWNTLSSHEETIAGMFYRSALIVDAIMHCPPSVRAMSFKINSFIDACQIESLALYLYGDLLRPVSYVLEFLDHLSKTCLEMHQNYILTKQNSEYQLLLMNPCYFNPERALNAYIIDQTMLSLNININHPNIYKKNVEVRRYILDKDHGGIFYKQQQVGFQDYYDAELQEYLSRTSIYQLDVLNFNHQETIEIDLDLSVNAVVLMIIRMK